MAQSGVKIGDILYATFENRMKRGREYKILAFKLDEHNTEVILDESNSETRKDAEGADKYADEASWRERMGEILASLNKESRFFVYDVEFMTQSGIVNQKPVLLMWNPEGAPPKQKMVLTSTKDAFHNRVCPGIVAKQATSADEATSALNDVK